MQIEDFTGRVAAVAEPQKQQFLNKENFEETKDIMIMRD